MNILLAYPRMPDTFYAFRHLLDVMGKKGAYPPLGLLTVAALLPETWSRRLVDLNVRPIESGDLEWCDMVFLSAMNVQEESVREIVSLCNDASVPVVAGGPLFTHEHARFEGIQHFVLNEAELTLPPFIDDLLGGEAKAIYESDEYANMEETPVPELGLVDMDDYLYGIIQYSRGCPYMCDFCDVTALFGRKPRTKSFEQIEQELEAILATGKTDSVLFADDNLIGNKRLLKEEILPKLAAWRERRQAPFLFATQLTLNLVDDSELMELLLQAGFRHIFVGIETPEEESLGASGKRQNLRRDMLENVRTLHRAGFIVAGGFIVGFDTDTEAVFEVQKNFIQASGITLPIVNVLKAPPGTELFDRMEREGRLIRDFAFTECETNLATVMHPDLLFDGFQRLIEEIHSPEGSFERICRFAEDYRFPKMSYSVRHPIRWRHLRTALRILWFTGVRSKSRKYFWKHLWLVRKSVFHLNAGFMHAVLSHQMERTAHHTLGVMTQTRHLARQVPDDQVVFRELATIG